jgi:holo-[acyl-carrier protein] synthase
MIIGIGSDLIDITRIERTLARFGDRFLQRVFTETERRRSDRRANRAASYAKRYAAKEACAKALGAPKRARWREIEVVVSPDGRPSLLVTGRTAEVAAAAGIRAWHVSLTHDGGVAVAVVVAES